MGLNVSYSKDLFPGKNLVSHWPGLCDTKVFPGEGLWCHTDEGAANVTPKWVSLRLVLLICRTLVVEQNINVVEHT